MWDIHYPMYASLLMFKIWSLWSPSNMLYSLFVNKSTKYIAFIDFYYLSLLQYIQNLSAKGKNCTWHIVSTQLIFIGGRQDEK